jgi:signal transduction histidine kinase
MLVAMGIRLRFTLLYGVMFLLSSAVLLAITAAFSARESTVAPTGSVPPEQRIADLQERLSQVSADQAHRLYIGSALALAIMFVMSLVLGSAAAARVIRPLRTITEATRRITADSLHERLAVTGPVDEVKALADTIDGLLGRLEEAFAAQRRFVADASHELRTPLATIRASLDVAMAKPSPPPPETVLLADRVRAMLDQVERLLEGLLVLARAQHGALDDRTSVAVGELVTAAVPPDAPVTVRIEGPDLVTAGNPVLLARMVSNVVENAVRHNIPGGWVQVVVGPETLVVENGGPVLDPVDVGELARPFRRLGVARTGSSGSGLGLAIASAVAMAHGGALAVAARSEGGLRVVISLPREGTSA